MNEEEEVDTVDSVDTSSLLKKKLADPVPECNVSNVNVTEVLNNTELDVAHGSFEEDEYMEILEIREDGEEENENEECDDGDVESFNCAFCDFQSGTVEELDEHIVLEHEELDEEAFEDRTIDEDENEQIQDELSESKNDAAFTISLDSDDSNSVSGTVTKWKKQRQVLPAFYDEYKERKIKKVFVCPYCGYQSMKKSDMNSHLNKHKEPVEIPIYACAECSYTTKRKCDMSKHLLTHCKNGSVPMYKCEHCPYVTKRKGDLNKHMLCHSKPVLNIFSCTECSYTTKRQGDLKKHQTCHQNQRKKEFVILNCSECGYTSKRLNDLHKHVTLHCDRLVKGAFKCTKCDYASLVGSHFAKHVLSQCRVCEKPVTLFPKDNSMEEYIVLEEDELHLYQLEKNNVPVVEVYEQDDIFSRRKRKASNELNDSKGSKVQKTFVELEEEEVVLVEMTPEDQLVSEDNQNSKVVVLAGYDNDRNATI